jgi:hypothetical protein
MVHLRDLNLLVVRGDILQSLELEICRIVLVWNKISFVLTTLVSTSFAASSINIFLLSYQVKCWKKKYDTVLHCNR